MGMNSLGHKAIPKSPGEEPLGSVRLCAGDCFSKPERVAALVTCSLYKCASGSRTPIGFVTCFPYDFMFPNDFSPLPQNENNDLKSTLPLNLLSFTSEELLPHLQFFGRC